MKSIITTIVIGILLAAIFSSHSSFGQECKDIKRVDKCAQTLYVYGNREIKFPSTVPEARSMCRKKKEAEKCVRDYASSCSKAFTRQYINIMLAGPIQVVKDRCTRTGIREMLKYKECLDLTKSDIDACNLETIEDSMRITLAKKDNWIPLTCCFLSKSAQCSLAAVEKKCTKNKDAASYVSDNIRALQGDVYDLLCGNGHSWGSEKCQKVTRGLGFVDPNTERPKSILPIAFDMIEKYLRRD